jgi:FkbM family methyltransferase
VINVPYYSHPGTRNDEWVVNEIFQGGRGGYYVEAGAFDGLTHSNTLTLERNFGWVGLLVEGNPIFAEQMIRNRPGNTFSTKAISLSHLPSKGTMLQGGQWTGLQELMTRKFLDQHQERANPGVEVETATLHAILEEADAPKRIDYLSLDIEGGELPVLIDYFHRTAKEDLRRFGCITVEYQNDACILQSLNTLLDFYGYRLIKLSGWDAFYQNKIEVR